jgi:polysaccharide pyruvyl transferase WcaK-like protein
VIKIKKITILDTSICTENIGDKIIMESCDNQIKGMFQENFYVNIPTHDVIGKASYYHLKTSDFKFICGTNLLSSKMNKYNQWKINLYDAFKVDDVILMGVGWWQYQNKPNIYTKYLLKNILSGNYIHSVRDSYTEKQLKSIGIKNVINTSCPTMWNLTPEFCKNIPTKKSKDVVCTLTDYNKNEKKDKELLNILISNYDKVYFWIQAYDDYKYLIDLGLESKVHFLNPTLKALDEILKKGNIDYVGTRLHAGIRALNNKVRSIIIGIDNRAKEKSKDFNLKVFSREDDLKELSNMINSEFETQVKIPIDNIKKWKSQFERRENESSTY